MIEDHMRCGAQRRMQAMKAEFLLCIKNLRSLTAQKKVKLITNLEKNATEVPNLSKIYQASQILNIKCIMQ